MTISLHRVRSHGRVSAILLPAFLLMSLMTGCFDHPLEPVVPPTSQQELQRAAVGSQTTYGLNFYSVPGGTWPGVPWNGDLVVYAHGYYAPADDPWNPLKDVVDNTPIAQIVNGLGMAYASTAYREQGLVVPMAVEDIVGLIQEFNSLNGGPPRHIYLVGPSEGGLVTTLVLEKHPGLVSGGLEMCGPVGDFRRQLDYFGDFHLVFNYFAPNTVPGSPAGIPPVGSVEPISLDEWNNTYKPSIQSWVGSNAFAAEQVLNVTRASIDPADPATVISTCVDILWYNLFATNDAIVRLGGRPFNNRSPYRWYHGSTNDLRLNTRIPRYSASPVALNSIQSGFQTSGSLNRPLVSLHTTGDPIIPYWHASLYQAKVLTAGSGLQYAHIPILRYGHCNFKVYEVLAGFALLVLKSTGQDLLVPPAALPNRMEREPLRALAERNGARPRIVEEGASR